MFLFLFFFNSNFCIYPEFVTDWGDEEKEDEEEENEEKEDEAGHMNDGGSGSYDEDFHDY